MSSNRAESDRSFAVKLMRDLVVPTFVLDADCNVIIWNRACERLTGVSAKELIGTREHWRAFYDSPRPCLADLVVQGVPVKSMRCMPHPTMPMMVCTPFMQKTGV